MAANSSPVSLAATGAEIITVAEPSYPLLLVCDHASNFIPPELNSLGLAPELLESHIAWDIGAGPICRQLASILNVPAVLCRHSRLLVDCNRNLDDPTAFPVTSDNVFIPGNQNLSRAVREARANEIYWPYHHSVRDQLRALERYAAAPAVIAIHSFTPEMEGARRPWHFGVLWDKDDRISRPLIGALSDDPKIVVGDNEPYSGRHPADFTLDHHAEAEGLAHVGIEVRQDLAPNQAKAAACAAMLASVLREILSDKQIYTHRAGTGVG
jgi:predicted N-formylglutamate amidohydrolase